MPSSPSSTRVGSGSAPSKAVAPRSGAGSTVRQRKAPASSGAARKPTGAGAASMWKFYTEDSPGIKVGPVPVLVISLIFIAFVFMLHIWDKYNRN
ncbi:hypothetical protein LSH36_420g01022 [Paralvinella palmiformis]|uniref:Protein transport protein Sec61 subunit beta n=1 Tax=Paralvinella palmiformis TaxID=53620 RepID=A0AAD9JBL4_9ANNE|nr:hypothetical protein LSH36_420g01022 [Paralvinella palmiformis]